MLVGAHLSVAGGYQAAVDYALEVGCECMQIFAKSPRQWRAKALDPVAAAEFTALRERAGLGPLFTHTAYLINPATDNPELRANSIAALADEITRGRLLSAAGVVTHLGNDPLGNPTEAAKRVAATIVRAFEAAGGEPGHTKLLLENTAGAGTSYGSGFGEMGAVLDELPDDIRASVGLCIDTCHAHAYGMDLSTPQAWDALVDDADSLCGPCAIGLIHANDCKFGQAEHKDRHEWIGDGFLGNEAFESMMCCERLRDICCITEMPGEVPEKDVINTARLKAFRDKCR